MPGTGTLINAGAVIVGSLLGLLMRKGIPQRFKDTIFQILGVVTLLIGVSGVLADMFHMTSTGHMEREDILLLIASLVIGGVLGELIGIERGFERLGEFARKKLSPRQGDDGFAAGFVGASVLFCVGAMSVVGALEDGLNGNPTTLIAKSILDGTMSVIFASIYGPGVLLSVLVILVYQGGITMLAGVLQPIATPEALSQMSMVGSALISCIGLNMLNLTRIRVANWLPATFIPILYDLCLRIFISR